MVSYQGQYQDCVLFYLAMFLTKQFNGHMLLCHLVTIFCRFLQICFFSSFNYNVLFAHKKSPNSLAFFFCVHLDLLAAILNFDDKMSRFFFFIFTSLFTILKAYQGYNYLFEVHII